MFKLIKMFEEFEGYELVIKCSIYFKCLVVTSWLIIQAVIFQICFFSLVVRFCLAEQMFDHIDSFQQIEFAQKLI